MTTLIPPGVKVHLQTALPLPEPDSPPEVG